MNKLRLIPKFQNPFGTIDYPIYDSNIQNKANQAQLIDSNANWLKGYLDNGVAGLKSIPDRITNYLGNIVEDISKPFGTEEGRRMSQALRVNGKYIDENNKTHYTPNQFVVNPMIFSIAPNSKVITLKQALDDSKGLDFFGWLKNGKAHYRLQNPTNNSFSSVVQMGDDVMVDVPNYLSDIVSQKVPTYTVGRASKIARKPNTKKLLSKSTTTEPVAETPKAVEVKKTIEDMKEIIRQKLLKEKRYGPANGTNGYYLDNSLGGDPKTFKLLKMPRDEGYLTIEELVPEGRVPGTNPNMSITANAKFAASQSDPSKGQKVELRGREKGSVNGMGSVGVKWAKAEANEQIPKDLRRQVTNAAKNGASNKEIDKMRHDILKQLGLL